jgi:cyclohexadienyl dehydratase
MMKKITLIILLIISCTHQTFSANGPALRIGTTGDYPPLTYYNNRTEQYSGFDIDMARSLAKYLRMKLIFVKTTWSTHSQDLEDQRFDMAVGGISDTPERHKKFLVPFQFNSDRLTPILSLAIEFLGD